MNRFVKRSAFLLFLIIAAGFHALFAQEFTLSVTPQYGAYKMGDLKDLQAEQAQNISDSLNTTPKTMYDFPPYWGYRINAGLGFKKHLLSLSVGQNATGGRVHYSDYSGTVRIDKKASCTNLSVRYSFELLNSERFGLAPGVGLGMTFSKLSTDNLVEIFITEEKTSQSGEYKGRQMFINPEITFYYFPLKNLFFELTAGYFKQLTSSSMQDSSSSSVLKNERADEVLVDWSGYRLGAGFGYKFNRKK